ncbi:MULTISPECIES: DUF4123 domain-containing protein [unclassified Massilia]|uniref:DUF4123 domain-containing protein n=1 Tax=unclassified Massilia TaxID=2609279 RepID=UPI0017848CA5|nr:MULTISPECIES: DUF4123 domain-containing protein [unclassified Massilia]MBD8528681.1 DUF4123 domain-containing protein [Massilia sp. CFBP 13647]MBD8672285.1 DUF4123 domain-containing protein [Massilia sp. CFBP 13721]
MLIDAFQEDFIDALDMRAAQSSASNGLYLLIDSVFVPGLHKALATNDKALLFASLPGCSNEVADASPFLTPYIPRDKRMRSLLRRCRGWPMLSLVETSEPLSELAARLSAWCIVESDAQRFNFRFPDTRRLPAIFRTLDPMQRAQFTGPTTRWSYINREACWDELEVTGANVEHVANPVLDGQQFAALVDDSHADEVLVLLGDRGHAVSTHPSISHARVTAALHVAALKQLAKDDVLDWCEWLWRCAEAGTNLSAAAVFEAWRNTFSMEK